MNSHFLNNRLRPVFRSTAVDPKYAKKKTSGLTVTIQPLSNYFDINAEHADHE